MAVEVERVLRKLDFIEENLDDLKNFQDISLEEYLSNRHTQKIVERTLEIIFQAAIDANRHILKEGFQIIVGEYREGFTEMGKLKVLSDSLEQILNYLETLEDKDNG